MTQGRPYGKRLRQTLEVVAVMGPMPSGKVWPWLDGVKGDNAGKYCSRAVEYGLMVCHGGFPRLFSVVPNWRDLIDRPKVEKPKKPKPVARTYAPHALHSIWAKPAVEVSAHSVFNRASD